MTHKTVVFEGRAHGRKDKTWTWAYSEGRVGEKNEEVEETKDKLDMRGVGGRKRRDPQRGVTFKKTSIFIVTIVRTSAFLIYFVHICSAPFYCRWSTDWVQWTLASCVVLQPHNICHHLHREKGITQVMQWPWYLWSPAQGWKWLQN
jgi:hypothetical protein